MCLADVWSFLASALMPLQVKCGFSVAAFFSPCSFRQSQVRFKPFQVNFFFVFCPIVQFFLTSTRKCLNLIMHGNWLVHANTLFSYKSSPVFFVSFFLVDVLSRKCNFFHIPKLPYLAFLRRAFFLSISYGLCQSFWEMTIGSVDKKEKYVRLHTKN